LGLGDIGARASKPVMEGKAVLFKKFAGIDAFDIEINETDPKKLVEICRAISPTFGGINLEDIKAPECFYVEKELKASTNIPVMHDDQHGTAIITTAGLINALRINGKKPEDIKIVVSGSGAAGIACAKMYKNVGVKHILMLDSKGVIHSKRDNLSPEKKEFAIETEARTLDDAINHCKKFDINYEICPIDKLIKTYEKIFLNKKISTHRIGNLSARIRMMVLYDLSEELDAVVVGTSNLSELMLGYGTIFGDLACAFNPIGEIFKTEIFEFAKFLKIDEKIISKKPSADLFEGQNDEQDLGYDYETLDKVLKKIYDDGLNFKELCKIFDESLVKFIISKIEQNSFKRRMPKIANIRKSSANTIF